MVKLGLYIEEVIKMKVLVACEESQRVCTAFRAKGHEAYSCDIEICSGGHPEWHICDCNCPNTDCIHNKNQIRKDVNYDSQSYTQRDYSGGGYGGFKAYSEEYC